MLSLETVDNIIHANLPDEALRNYLVTLTCDTVDQTIFNLFIDRMREMGEVEDLDFTPSTDQLFDCCGTGGSGLPRYNTSTTAAFVLAAGGVKVAKFGNRSASSSSGSFDFLEAIGLGVQVPPSAVGEVLTDVGLVFLFAQQYYPALGALSRIRRSIQGSTIFNFLGPLLNPLKPSKRLLGTINIAAQKLIANYLANDGHTERALVVRAENGLDELIPYGDNHVLDVSPGSIEVIQHSRRVEHGNIGQYSNGKNTNELSNDPDQDLTNTGKSVSQITYADKLYGGKYADIEGLRDRLNGLQNSSTPLPGGRALSHDIGLSCESNARIFHELLQNPLSCGYLFDLVSVNAAAGFLASGNVSSIEDGIEKSRELIVSGRVKDKFEQCKKVYGKFIG